MPQNDAKLIYDEMSETIIQTAENLVTTNGTDKLTVRAILKELNITNRVFYNRFSNIDAVLEIVYKRTVEKMQDTIKEEYNGEENFFDYVMNLLTKVLISTYEIKMKFSQYTFEYDSYSDSNYKWWINEIKQIIEYAKSKSYIKDVDSDILSYTIWCFCRGFNADAVGRGMPKEEAIKAFQYTYNIFFEGLKK